MENIREIYPEIPVKNAHNFSGQTIGDFNILYRTSYILTKSQEAHWVCQCNRCKKYFIKKASFFKGKSECSCRNDLSGQQFGRLTVLYPIDRRTKNKGIIYHCRCSCGNEKDIPAETLRRGESNSCGCITKERMSQLGKNSRIDLTGKRFGKLVALYPIYSKERKHTKWHCRCDCGNEVDVDMGNLRQGFSQSCGCVNSRQEENIIKLLTKNNISFKYQYRFPDLLTKEFDFYVEESYVVEFDGMQHFKPMGYGHETPEEKLKRTRQNDLLKNKYCFEHNIPLIRIPYETDYTLKDLKIETTRFLLTPDNEEEYYKD